MKKVLCLLAGLLALVSSTACSGNGSSVAASPTITSSSSDDPSYRYATPSKAFIQLESAGGPSPATLQEAMQTLQRAVVGRVTSVTLGATEGVDRDVSDSGYRSRNVTVSVETTLYGPSSSTFTFVNAATATDGRKYLPADGPRVEVGDRVLAWQLGLGSGGAFLLADGQVIDTNSGIRLRRNLEQLSEDQLVAQFRKVK